MSDLFYNFIYGICYPGFVICHKPTTMGLEHLKDIKGPVIVGSNHTSPYDIAILMYYLPVKLDFVSTTEIINSRAGWIYRMANAMPLDQSKPDPKTVRDVVDRLKRGRSIGVFPEGKLSFGDDSVLHGGSVVPGIGGIARLGKAPMIPCAIENSLTFARWNAWFPNQAKYGIAFGEPMPPPDKRSGPEGLRRFEAELAERIRELHRGLLEKMGIPEDQCTTRRRYAYRE